MVGMVTSAASASTTTTTKSATKTTAAHATSPWQQSWNICALGNNLEMG